jgi:hypothetical protein
VLPFPGAASLRISEHCKRCASSIGLRRQGLKSRAVRALPRNQMRMWKSASPERAPQATGIIGV